MKVPKQSDETWVQSNGVPIRISDMTEDHAKNVLRLVLRRMRKKMNEQAVQEMFSSWVRDQVQDLPRMDRPL